MAPAFFLASTSIIAHQDAAGLIDKAKMSAERWRATMVSAPHGSIHSAKVALPINDEPRFDEAVGLRLDDAVTGDTMILEPDARSDIVTGSIGEHAKDEPAYPAAVREAKEDLLMSRAGVDSRVRRDEETGALRRPPRLLLERPRTDEPHSSFLPGGPGEDHAPVRLAALGAGDGAVGAPTLESPIEAVHRRKIEARKFAKDLHCMATAIYFEARSEPQRGQQAVAQVVLNRVDDHRYPDSICDVIYQNQNWRNRCQFSFACDGRPEHIRDQGSWVTAMAVAEEAMQGESQLEEVGGSTHYHASYVSPRWSRLLRRINRIGTHIFYKLRPGQT